MSASRSSPEAQDLGLSFGPGLQFSIFVGTWNISTPVSNPPFESTSEVLDIVDSVRAVEQLRSSPPSIGLGAQDALFIGIWDSCMYLSLLLMELTLTSAVAL